VAAPNVRAADGVTTLGLQKDLTVAHEEGAVLYTSEPNLEWFYLEALSVNRYGSEAEREAFIAGYRGAERRVNALYNTRH
jgi:hypothetical protein